MFFRLYLPWQWAHSSLQLLIQLWFCAPGTHYGLVDRGSVEYKVCPTLVHMASTGNQTSDLLILSPTPNPLGNMLKQYMSIGLDLYRYNKTSSLIVAIKQTQMKLWKNMVTHLLSGFVAFTVTHLQSPGCLSVIVGHFI